MKFKNYDIIRRRDTTDAIGIYIQKYPDKPAQLLWLTPIEDCAQIGLSDSEAAAFELLGNIAEDLRELESALSDI